MANWFSFAFLKEIIAGFRSCLPNTKMQNGFLKDFGGRPCDWMNPTLLENCLIPCLFFYCVPLAGLIVILALFGFYLPSLSCPRGAASSPRSLLAHGQRPFELPSQLRPTLPPLRVPELRLLGRWQRPIDLLPLARTLSKELSFWLWYHLFGTHLAMPASWPSLKCIVQRQNKWKVSKTCQPWWFFSWRVGERGNTKKQLYHSAAQHPVEDTQSTKAQQSLTWIRLFQPSMYTHVTVSQQSYVWHFIISSLLYMNKASIFTWAEIRQISKASDSVCQSKW